jgi:2-(1,2-epoxy-1,2-dihydrophenyl)acetyl-CoA isomerase
MEILLTNPTLTAEEARELGLVNRVVADGTGLHEASTMACELAAGAPRALAETKRLLWSGLGSGMEEQLPDEARTVSALSGTEDAREGLAAVLERRAPDFTAQ